MNQFTQEETNVLLAFLERVNLNGKEAETLVFLKNRIREITQAPKEPTKEVAEDKTKK